MSKLLFQRELFFPSVFEGLNICLDMVSEVEHLFNLDFDKSFALQTVLVESVENAFLHGNKGASDLDVRVYISISASEIFLEVEDKGEGFDINSIPSPIEGDNIYNECGRGLFFIKSLCSSCYTMGKGNIVRIILER
ncbi:MAG: ATP-binding protein [Mariniphaga sp.]